MRRLGGTRAGKVRLTPLLRKEAVSSAEMLTEVAAGTAERCPGRHVLALQDTTGLRSHGGRGEYLHAVMSLDEKDGTILGVIDGIFLDRQTSGRPVCAD